MHSKTFTVDNQATIVGGRNIGDEYFDATPDLAFADLDVLAVGPVVPDVSSEFDQYWNSEHAFPMTSLLPETQPMPIDKLRKDLADFATQKEATVYIDALEHSRFANALRGGSAELSYAKAIVVHDSPEKLAKSEAWKDNLLISQLAPYILESKKEFVLVSPYFVPGKRAAEALCDMSERGVNVHILTNSLASNDVAAVHTGYIRHRKQLLRCGVTLYELNEQLKVEQKELFSWLPGLSKSSLHAKTMSFDHKAMFVGSFNFDQRSLFLNNEIGVLFYEPVLASKASDDIDKNVNKVAFHVELITDEHGKESLRWTALEGGKQVVFEDEPYATFMQKAAVQIMRLLPLDSML
jgi:putative cardiolipin synthase